MKPEVDRVRAPAELEPPEPEPQLPEPELELPNSLLEQLLTAFDLPELTLDAWVGSELAAVFAELGEPVDDTPEPGPAEPVAGEPATTGPSAAEPATTGPEPSEPVTPEPQASEPAVAEPEPAEPAFDEPAAAEPAAAGPAPSGPTPSGPEEIQQRVEAELDRLPHPTVPSAEAASERFAAQRAAIEARGEFRIVTVRSTSEAVVGRPPAHRRPPKPDPGPIPEQMDVVKQKSGHTLSPAVLPTVPPSPLGTLPDTTRPILSELELKAVKYEERGIAALTKGTDEAGQKEAADLTKVLGEIRDSNRDPQTPAVAAPAANVSVPGVAIVDHPVEGVALTPQQRALLADVVVRLRSEVDADAQRLLQAVRMDHPGYPGGALERAFEKKPLGQGLLPEITTALNADAAGLTNALQLVPEQVEKAVAERRTEAAARSAQAREATSAGAIAAQGAAATEDAKATATAEAAARAQLLSVARERKRERPMSTAEARARRAVSELGEPVATELARYDAQLRERVRAIADAVRIQAAAIRFARTRDEMALAPARGKEQTREGNLQVAAVLKWADDANAALQQAQAGLVANAQAETDGFKSALQEAARRAFEALRDWGRTHTKATDAWWTELDTQLDTWATDTNARVELWKTQQGELSRLALLQDFAAIEQLSKLQEAKDEKALSAYVQGLDAETRAVVDGFSEGGGLAGALAAGVRERVRARLQQKLEQRLEAEVSALDPKDEADWESLNALLERVQPGAKLVARAEKIHKAVDRLRGHDEEEIFEALGGLSPIAGKLLPIVYERMYKQSLEDALLGREWVGHLNKDEMDTAHQLLAGTRVEGAIGAIHSALAGWGAAIGAVNRILRELTDEERTRVIAGYKARYGESLEEMLRSQSSLSGSEITETIAIAGNDPLGANAVLLARSVRTVHMDGDRYAVLDRETATRALAQVRKDVEAESARRNPPWDSAQIEAQVAVRSQALEQRFEETAGKEWWAEGRPKGTTAMRAAFGLARGPARDLLEGMADNDLAKVDVARIRLEDMGVYAEDAAINAVFSDQADRSMADAQRDLGPLLNARLERRLSAEDKTTSRTEEQRVNRRMELERENAKELTAEADARTRDRMDRLGVLYQLKSGRTLAQMVEANMSGASYNEAKARVEGHGVLTPYQKIRYSIEGRGTDVPTLRATLATMSRQDIRKANATWMKDHPGETLYAAIEDDTSGREQGDLLDMAYHGAPQNAAQLVRAAERRFKRDRDDETRFGAGLTRHELEFAAKEVAGLQSRLLAMRNARGGSDAGWRASTAFDIAIERANTAIDVQRRAVDSVADMLANAAAIVTAVALGFLLAPFTGGASAVVAAAVISSIAATAVSMGVKQLVKGGAYGHEEIYTDLAVGAVDALVAALTAGLGKALLGKGVKGVTPVAKSSVFKGLLRMGSIGRAAASGQAKVAGKLGAMGTQGLLVRGLERHAVLGGLANSKRFVNRAIAHGTAELIEQSVQAVPSSFTAALLDERLLRDPGGPARVFHNTLEGTVESVKMGMGMSGLHHGVSSGLGLGMRGVRSVAEHVRAIAPPEIRMPTGDVLTHIGTPRERVADFRSWRAENPQGTAREFNAIRRAEAIERWQHADVHAERSRAAREHMLADLPPVERGNYADVPIRTISDAEFTQLTRKPTSDAHLLVRDGQAIILLREGAPPSAARSLLPQVRERVFAGSGGMTAEGALPKRLQDTPVRVDHLLDADEVRVVPIPREGAITGVEVVVGPKALPIDVALHANEVARIRRWTGKVGDARLALARYAERVGVRLDTPADRARFEAAGEVGKLLPIVEERIRRATEARDPAAAHEHMHQAMDLLAQQEHAMRILTGQEPAVARGYIAAKATPPAKPAKPHEEAHPKAEADVADEMATVAKADALAQSFVGLEKDIGTHERHIKATESSISTVAANLHKELASKGLLMTSQHGKLEEFCRRCVASPEEFATHARRLGDERAAWWQAQIERRHAELATTRQHLVNAHKTMAKVRADMDAMGAPALRAELNRRLTYERLKQGLGLICFPSDTPVAVPGGSVPIATLRPGDAVLSADPRSGGTQIDYVTERVDGWTDWLVEIEAGGEVLRATRSHPLALAEGGWLPARLVVPGMRLQSLDGEDRLVERVSMVPGNTATCNLEVAGNHCYFAGAAGILAHNGVRRPARDFKDKDTRRPSEIYVFMQKVNGTWVVVYVGSTNKDGLSFKRLPEHLGEGRSGEAPHKAAWAEAYDKARDTGTLVKRDTQTDKSITFGEYKFEVVDRGEFTDLTLAIREQAHIFAHEGNLLNVVDAISEEKFILYFTDERRLYDIPCR